MGGSCLAAAGIEVLGVDVVIIGAVRDGGLDATGRLDGVVLGVGGDYFVNNVR